MPNSFFRFKQFMIHQDRCAMKVCTDACLFGAWFSARVPAGERVLDIGSGTGLLMLMLAQKYNGRIRGIEIDSDAFGQLQENISSSPWKDRLQAFQGDVRDFIFQDKADIIISNPPFFEDDLSAGTDAKNLARHGTALKLSELIAAIDTNLETSGSFAVLLPYSREEYFVEIADACGFNLRERVRVRQGPGHDLFRSMLHFSRGEGGTASSVEIRIRNDKGDYTEEFVELMKDYYLFTPPAYSLR